MSVLPPPVWADLFYGGVWNAVEGDVAVNSAVSVTRGRTGERDSAGPAQGALPFLNKNAKYSRRNPNSALFGSIGLNTAVRYGVTAGSPWLLMEGTTNTGSYVSTPSAASLNITGDIEVRMELAFDDPASGQSLAGRFGAAGSFSWRVGLSGNAYPFILWSEDGTATKNAISTTPMPAMPGQRLALRIVLDVNNASGGNTTTFSIAKSIDAAEEYWQMVGTPVTNSGTTSVFNPAQPLWAGAANVAGLNCFSGRLFRFQLYNAGALIADLNTATATVGASTATGSLAQTWTLQGASSLTNRQRLFQGEISSWNPALDKSGADRRVQTSPAGITQRLSSGNKVLRSPLYREMTNPGRTGIVAYWPCEENTDSTVVASGTGGTSMSIAGTPSFSSFTGLLGSDALPDMAAASFSGSVDGYTVTTQTSFRSWVSLPTAGVGAQASLYRLAFTGTARKWELTLKTDGSVIIDVTASDGTSLLSSILGFGVTNGRLISFVLELTQDGADIDWRLIAEDYTGLRSSVAIPASSASGTVTSQTMGRATNLLVGSGGGLSGVSVGHLTLANSLAAYSNSGPAAIGWFGEGARTRFNRLCREQAVAGSASIETTYQPLMGAQKSGQFLDLLREVETLDGGILTERPDGLGLAYRGASTMWNQEPALVLDWTAGLIDAITPKDDDRAAFNDLTAKRIDGSQYTYTLETGVNSVEDIGLYDTSVDLSVSSDADLPDQAYRRVQLATVDEMRYPLITLSLANTRVYAMLDQIYAVDIGDMIRLDHIPSDFGAGSVELIVIGISDVFSSSDWSRSFVCVPGEPWNALTTSGSGADTFSRADTAGSVLAGALTTTQTAVNVSTTAQYRWVNSSGGVDVSASDFPFEIETGGEVMNVTAATPAARDTFTRSASSSWGSADIGGAWTNSGGAASDYAVSGTVGTHSLTSVNVNRLSLLTAPSADVDLMGDVATSVLATGGSHYIGLVARCTDINNHYYARATFPTSHALQLVIQKRVGGVQTDLATVTVPGTHVAGTFYRLRFQVIGSVLQAKLWTVGSNEPQGWHATATDTALTAAASIGTRSILDAANTNTLPVTASHDNFTLLTPQTFTVTRSVNGVVKTHIAGEDLSLHRPLYAAI
ncbi:hypothetical protein [Streptomyces sp. NPDC051665]|uniref:hypothetical protein n=1 Tax=Streptomyces sp. NPDC051665 TaxID=3154647 RepID=UPI0034421A57